MFQALSDRLNGIFKKLRGYGRLTEENIGEALR
ncbi:MAG TPA: signal recognition particle receptor subunit alpha, partial [Candidatus Methylomirabilis sp.]|nr:signal recognition particle receptor subunit alpha [Candidatus Methylomirabilis sp.]